MTDQPDDRTQAQPAQPVRPQIGPYQLESELGRGGMAIVYRAYDPKLDRHVAVKVITGQLTGDEYFLRSFEREARSVGRLRHPNILTVYYFGEHDGMPYLAMELVEAGSLKDRLQGPLDLATAAKLLTQIASALDFAHGLGIIHRDIKPNNILMDRGDRAVLADFGLAKVLAEARDSLTISGVVGTPAYMSPEQCTGEAVDHRSDIYSLGVVAFEMLTGQRPFRGQTTAIMFGHVHQDLPRPTALNPVLTPAVEAVLLKCLAKRPEDRYGSATEFATALAAAAGLDAAGQRGSPSGALSSDVTEIGSDPSVPAVFGQLGSATQPADSQHPVSSGRPNIPDPRLQTLDTHALRSSALRQLVPVTATELNVTVADLRAFVVREQYTLEVAQGLALAKKLDAFGTLAKFFSRPRDEDIALTYAEKRYQPFWHVITRSSYVYERQRSYHLAVESAYVRDVTLAGAHYQPESGAIAIEGLEYCAEEHVADVYQDGLTGEKLNYAIALKYFYEPIPELGAFQPVGAIVVPPEVRATAVVRPAIAGAIKAVQADRVLEETIEVETIDLFFRPVYAFRFEWTAKAKTAIVEVDGLLGDVVVSGQTFQDLVGKWLEANAIFDLDPARPDQFAPTGLHTRLQRDR